MRVSVCVPATRPDTIGATVKSIVAQTYRDWELVVVAQGARREEIADAVRRELNGHRGRVVRQDGRGASRARNAALAVADGDVIAMTDDDCEAEPSWLAVMVDRFRAEPRAGIIGGAVLAPPLSRGGPANCPTCKPADALYDPRAFRSDPPDGFAWLSANVAICRSAAEALGAFDECLGSGTRFPAAEDVDFQWRAERRGIATLTTPQAIVHHTYGWRCGARAVWKLQRNYARGNGAFAAKLTLLGDDKGRQDLQLMRRLTAFDWFERRRPIALPAGIRRYYHFSRAYRECLENFQVDVTGILEEKTRNGADR